MEVVGWWDGGERRGGASYKRGHRKFLMIYWGGGQNFSTRHHEKCIANLSLLLQFQIIFCFQLKDIHKNNYSLISDNFRSSLTTKRLSKKNLECFMSTREREKKKREKIFSFVCQYNRTQ